MHSPRPHIALWVSHDVESVEDVHVMSHRGTVAADAQSKRRALVVPLPIDPCSCWSRPSFVLACGCMDFLWNAHRPGDGPLTSVIPLALPLMPMTDPAGFHAETRRLHPEGVATLLAPHQPLSHSRLASDMAHHGKAAQRSRTPGYVHFVSHMTTTRSPPPHHHHRAAACTERADSPSPLGPSTAGGPPP